MITLEYLTPDALNLIGKCAAICYDSKTDKASNERRAIQCFSKGHLATLRFAHAIFHVKGISRACSHQFVRSKHLDFLQRSQRYCDEELTEVIYPIAGMDDKNLNIYRDAYDASRSFYKALREAGVKKEDARYVLPNASTTELYVVGNLQAWKDFLQLRDCKEAQWEIRGVAQEIRRLLHKELPDVF